MDILIFILITILFILLIFDVTLFLIVIDSLIFDDAIQNTFSNILNKIFNRGGKEWIYMCVVKIEKD